MTETKLRECPELLHMVVNSQGCVLATYSIREYAEDGCARISTTQPCRIVSYVRADRRPSGEREKALEEAAKVADEYANKTPNSSLRIGAKWIAQDIRALSGRKT